MKTFSAGLLGLLLLAACSADSPPQGDPKAEKHPDLRGFFYGPDVMIAEKGSLSWVQQALSGYRRAAEDDLPAKVVELPASACTFVPPRDGDEVHHVHVDEGVQALPIYAITQKDIAERTEAYVETYRASKGESPSPALNGEIDALRLVNVVVGKTEKPVYLVLTAQSKVMWNIQAGRQARIRRIAIIGTEETGIANVPEGVPVTALVGGALQSCGAWPERMPQADWGFVENVKGTQEEDVIRKNEQYAYNYSHWFQHNFGIASYDPVAEALGTSNALVGELVSDPKERTPYARVKGGTIMMAQLETLLFGTQEYEEQAGKIIHDSAERAAGGDLKHLLEGSH